MPSVNPDGKNIPGGSNEDGFYLLTATDTVTAQSNIVIKVNGMGRPNGSPFRSGDTIKYTQAADEEGAGQQDDRRPQLRGRSPRHKRR